MQITHRDHHKYVSFLSPDYAIRITAGIGNNNKHEASTKSANMKTSPSKPTSKLSVGLQNISNTNKLCLKLYFSHVPLLAFSFHGLGLLIFEASWSHLGVKYPWLNYTLGSGEFTSFTSHRRLNPSEWRRSLINFTRYSFTSILPHL
jgi:hypothetical protein